MKAKSLHKQEYLVPGEYEGLWSGYFVEIVFDNGMRTGKIELAQGVRGINCKCKVFVEEDGFLTVT